MAEYQRVEFPLVGGVDQHTDSRKVSPAQVLRAENTRIAKIGRYDQRYGLASVTSTVMTGSALSSSYVTMHARGDELVLAERARLLARSPAKDRLLVEDTLPEWTAESLPIAQTAGVVVDASVATIVNGAASYTCVVYGSEGTSTAPGTAQKIMAVVLDGNNNRTVVNVTQLSSGTNGYGPRVTYSGNVFICVWSDGAGNLKGRRIDMSASVPAWDTAINLRADQTGIAGVFAVCTGPSSGSWELAYQKGVAPNITIDLYRYDNSATLVQQATGTTGEAISQNFISIALAQFIAGSSLACCYTYRSAVPTNFARATVFNPTTLAVTTARFTVNSVGSAGVSDDWERITVCGIGSNMQVAWSYGGTLYGAGYYRSVWAEVVNPATGALVGLTKNLFGANIISDLLSTGGSTYALACVKTSNDGFTAATSGDVLDGSIVLCRFYGEDTTSSATQPQPVAVVEPRTGADYDFQAYGHVAAFAADASSTSTSFLSVYGQRSTLLEPANLPYSGIPSRAKIARVTLESGKRQSCELGKLTYLSGGVPCWYDGFRAGEVGFIEQPHAVAAKAGGGGLVASSTYLYAIVFCQVDSQGNVHRSTPWKMSVALGVGETKVTLTIPYYGCTRRQSVAKQVAFQDFGPPTIEIYRTVSNGTAYRLLRELIVNTASATDVTTFVDTFADSNLTNQRYLYDTATADGRAQLAHVNPPSATLCMTHRDRVWFAGCPDRKEVWVSSKYVQGEAPFFSEAFRIIVDDGGDITALASMDDKAIVFKSDRIFFVTGDGPDDSGLNSDWSAATKINGTVGCIEPRSVVVTPMGIVFQSSVSLSLLGRDLQVDARWGRPVEDSLAGATIVSATLHKTLTEVRFLLSSGVELRYDYAAQAWMTAVLTPGSASAWVGSTLYYLGGSSLYREDSTTYLDAGSFVGMTLEFAPLTMGGRLGEQYVSDVLLLCDRYTDHELKLETSTDGGSYAAETPKQWTAAELSALGTEYVLNYKPLRASRSRLAKVRLSSLTPSSGTVGTGRGFSIAGLTFKVADTGDKYQLMGTSQKG